MINYRLPKGMPIALIVFIVMLNLMFCQTNKGEESRIAITLSDSINDTINYTGTAQESNAFEKAFSDFQRDGNRKDSIILTIWGVEELEYMIRLPKSEYDQRFKLLSQYQSGKNPALIDSLLLELVNVERRYEYEWNRAEETFQKLLDCQKNKE